MNNPKHESLQMLMDEMRKRRMGKMKTMSGLDEVPELQATATQAGMASPHDEELAAPEEDVELEELMRARELEEQR